MIERILGAALSAASIVRRGPEGEALRNVARELYELDDPDSSSSR